MDIKMGRLFLFAVSIIGLTLSACRPEESKIVQWTVSPKINNYKLESIVIFPLANDDTTSTGTFYSTNHFLKSLKEVYPLNKFEIMDIRDAVQKDSLFLDRIIESIEMKHIADIKGINTSELGDSLKVRNPDAIILGRVNNSNKSLHFWQEPGFVTMSAWSTGCNFTYYMISTQDGRVLWMSNVMGIAYYEENVEFGWIFEKEMYPPLDMAISNGIDKIINTLPFKKQTESNY